MKPESTYELLRGILLSKKFSPFFHGQKFSLPNGSQYDLRITKIYRSIRPIGLRFAKYSYVSEISSSDGNTACGYGESENKLLSVQKSVSESVERIVFRLLKSIDNSIETSNGWSAHLNQKLCQKSATLELLERDAVLAHWLSSSPMLELDLSTAPSWLSTSATTEFALGQRFTELKVLISTKGYLPTITTVLLDNEGYAVLSHATSSEIEKAIYKSLAETCRIAHIVRDAERICRLSTRNETLTSPEDHIFTYTHSKKLPTWIFGPQVDFQKARIGWEASYKAFDPSILRLRFKDYPCGPLNVSRCLSRKVQDLYFGPTDAALIAGKVNLERVRELLDVGKDLNLLPHCVP